jgi:hypothetical protein
MHTNEITKNLVELLKRELPHYRITAHRYGYYPDEKDVKYYASRMRPVMPIPCGNAISIREKRPFFPKTLVRIISIDPDSYQKFLSGINILDRAPRPFKDIFPEPTMLCLANRKGESAYAKANSVMQSNNYDFATIDITKK